MMTYVGSQDLKTHSNSNNQTCNMNIKINLGHQTAASNIKSINNDLLVVNDMDSDSCSIKSDSGDLIMTTNQNKDDKITCTSKGMQSTLREGGNHDSSSDNNSLVVAMRDIQKVDLGEVETLEKEDKNRVNQART